MTKNVAETKNFFENLIQKSKVIFIDLILKQEKQLEKPKSFALKKLPNNVGNSTTETTPRGTETTPKETKVPSLLPLQESKKKILNMEQKFHKQEETHNIKKVSNNTKENKKEESKVLIENVDKKQLALSSLLDDDDEKQDNQKRKNILDSLLEEDEEIENVIIKIKKEEEKVDQKRNILSSLLDDEEETNDSKSKFLKLLVQDEEEEDQFLIPKNNVNLEEEINEELEKRRKSSTQIVINTMKELDEYKDYVISSPSSDEDDMSYKINEKSNLFIQLSEEEKRKEIFNSLNDSFNENIQKSNALSILTQEEEEEEIKEIIEKENINEEERRNSLFNSLLDDSEDNFEIKSKLLKLLNQEMNESFETLKDIIIPSFTKDDIISCLLEDDSKNNLEKKSEIISMLNTDIQQEEEKEEKELNGLSKEEIKKQIFLNILQDKDENSENRLNILSHLLEDEEKDFIPLHKIELKKKKSFDNHKIQTVLSFIDNEKEKEDIKNIISQTLNESSPTPRLNDEIEEDLWLPMEEFVDSFKNKPKDNSEESSRTIKNIIIIQSSIRGYLSRLTPIIEMTSPIIETLSPRITSPRTTEEKRKEQLKKFRENQQKRWDKFNESQSKLNIEEKIIILPIIEEEEIINILYEEDIIIENLLYEEDFIFENPLYEEDIIIINPLFEETEIFLNEKENDETLFIEELKNNVQIQDRIKGVHVHKKAFIGSELIDYILSANERYTRPDAIFLAQLLMDRFVFKSVKLTEREFKDESTSFYRFVEHYYHPAVLNGPPDDFNYQYLAKQEEGRLLRRIDSLWKSICNEYVKISSKKIVKISYKLLSISSEFQDLKKELYHLQKFDPLILEEEERKTFFINIYNILVIHALLLCGKPNSYISRTLFFKTKYYVIGNYKVSLDDIEHTILRGDHSIPHQLFIQCFGGKSVNELAVKLDPRIHFALHQATISSPILRHYESSSINEELDLSVRINLQNNIILQKNEIHLPNFFEIYGEDFGSIKKRLDFIYQYLNETQKLKYKEIRNSKVFVIKFLTYNWNLNKKDSQEEAEDLRIEYKEILKDLQYRKYFKIFSKRECNEENILFYEEIEKYEIEEDGYKRFILAKEIYNLYLSQGSEREININQKPVIKIKDLLKNEEKKKNDSLSYKQFSPLSLFEEIKNIIKETMLDIYARFQYSPEYQEMVLLQLENNLKDNAKKELTNLEISATMLGAQTGIKMKEKLKSKPYFGGLFEQYDKFKDNLVIVSNAGYEEVVPLSEIKRTSSSRLALLNAIGNESLKDETLRATYTDKQMDKMINAGNERHSVMLTTPRGHSPKTLGSLSPNSPRDKHKKQRFSFSDDQKIFGENVN